MAFLNEFKKRAKSVVWPVLGCLTMAYFGYHAVEGNRGLRTWYTVDAEITQAEKTHADLIQRRQLIEDRVALMRPESLNRDMLEERARAMLNLGYATDVVIADRSYQPVAATLASVVVAAKTN